MATYKSPADTRCVPLPAVGAAVSLVRIGADTADDYDWRTDTLYNPHPPHRRELASHGCPGSRSSVLRVLDRVRQIRATAVVVLNGEIDDPQAAAGLVRLVAQRYGLAFARATYWEIGNAPATWQYFGIPLAARREPEVPPTCSPDQYAALVTAYAAAIRAALGNATPLIVADEWITNATDQSWTDPVTAIDASYYPFNTQINTQEVRPPSAAEIAQSIAPRGASGTGDSSLDGRIAGLRANLEQYNGGKGLRLFVGSWNVDANKQANNPLYNSPAQEVFVARLLLHLARDHVELAAWSQPLYGFPPAPFVADQPTLGFHVFTALRPLGGAHVLHMSGRTSLDTLAARLPDGRVMVVLANAAAAGTVAPRLRLSGATAVAASVRTFAPATPLGATTRLPITAGGVRVAVPALGVAVVTLASAR